jgi:uncharacterized membrane protein YdbT with pleckstrin-like domain
MKLFGSSQLNEITKNEKIIKIIHRHWFDVFQQFLIVGLFIAVLFGGIFILPSVFPDTQGGYFSLLLTFFETTFAIIIWIYTFLIWIDYYFDVWIITSERVVNIEQRGLFVRQVSELKYNKIQDVTVDVGGFFPTILNYGDVHIQTAGEAERFFFRQVPDPYGIKNLVMDLQKSHENERVNELGQIIDKIKST